MAGTFDYNQAFSRNLGWLTAAEQNILRRKRVAIAGLGGVGGSHLLTLTRLGIGAFHLADPDRFELVNFNRQSGAGLSSLGQPKVQVMAQRALDINPQLNLRLFEQGVDRSNLDAFLDGVDLYVDGLDFFAIDRRREVFAACYQRDIPAVTAAPLGMGCALLVFLPGGMRFDEYFDLDGRPPQEQLLRFLIGLAPRPMHPRYLVDPSTISLAEHRGPSTALACELCAGMAAAAALKILLARGPILAAPHALLFDAYTNRLVHTHLRWGLRGPVQRLKIRRIRRQLQQHTPPSPTASSIPAAADQAPVFRVLDLARWAPSGDNTQPWRFEVVDPQRRFVVHGFDTRQECVYDLEGRASQLAIGALLETIAIAASGFGLEARFHRRADAPETTPQIDVELVKVPEAPADPLWPYIPVRVTNRRPFSATPLLRRQRQALENALPAGFSVLWLEHRRQKWAMARLLMANARIRLSIPEAYQVHRQMIRWKSRFAADGLPDQALGLSRAMLPLMRWAMKSWKRMRFMNRVLGSAWFAAFQLDFLPALRCAGHFLILAPQPPQSMDDYLAAGRAVQRFWLTATKEGLQLQPQQTPLIFADYTRRDLRFTQDEQAIEQARRLRQRLQELLGTETLERAVFLGRIGQAEPPRSRSVRLELASLILPSPSCSSGNGP